MISQSSLTGKRYRRRREPLRQERAVYQLLQHEPDSVCFTGHRLIEKKERERLTLLLLELLEDLYSRGFRRFICGGALGFDTLAAQCVLTIKASCPEAQLILVLPCRDQPSRWKERDQILYRQIQEAADEVHILASSYFEGCMQVRNRHMVDRSSLVLAYLKHMRGGTLSTVGYAVREKVHVLNLAMPDAVQQYMQQEH